MKKQMLSILGRNGNDNVGQAMPDKKKTAWENGTRFIIRQAEPDLRFTNFTSGVHLTYNGVGFTPTARHPDPAGGKNAGYSEGTSGFTLIELLVVVLIIGILAAVAVPQYQKAIDKTRLMNLVALMKPIKDAQETYYLANGVYSYDFETLDIAQNIPNTTKSIWHINEYHLFLEISSPARLEGTHNRLKNVSVLVGYNNTHWKGKWACYALNTDNRANQLCQNLANKKTRDGTGAAMGGVANIYYFIE